MTIWLLRLFSRLEHKVIGDSGDLPSLVLTAYKKYGFFNSGSLLSCTEVIAGYQETTSKVFMRRKVLLKVAFYMCFVSMTISSAVIAFMIDNFYSKITLWPWWVVMSSIDSFVIIFLLFVIIYINKTIRRKFTMELLTHELLCVVALLNMLKSLKMMRDHIGKYRDEIDSLLITLRDWRLQLINGALSKDELLRLDVHISKMSDSAMDWIKKTKILRILDEGEKKLEHLEQSLRNQQKVSELAEMSMEDWGNILADLEKKVEDLREGLKEGEKEMSILAISTRNIDFRRINIICLEHAALLIEHYLPYRLHSGEIMTDSWFKESMRQAAAALREKKKWLLTPKDDTWDNLLDVMTSTLECVVSGNWDALQRTEPAKITPSTVKHVIFNFLMKAFKTAIIAVLPALGFLAFQMSPLAVSGTVQGIIEVIVLLWVGVTFLWTYDPDVSAKFSLLKNMKDLFSGGIK